jgi:dipeptidyl aminopeptidase/acylaminoacyl peptidase
MTASTKPIPAPAPVGLREPAFLVDHSRAWSADGKQFAFRRVGTDSSGPSGVYIADIARPRPRYLCPAGPFGPANLSFSPDGVYLVANWELVVILIDTRTGEIRQPFYTHNRPTMPHFHPRLPMVAYARAAVFFGEDADSGAIHVFHLDTGVDTSLKAGDYALWGSFPRWAPDGRLLGYLEAFRRLRVIDPASQRAEFVFDTRDTASIESYRWLPGNGSEYVIAVTVAGLDPPLRYTTHIVRGRMGAWHPAVRANFLLHPLDEPSPNGSWVLTHGAAPGTDAGVLFLKPLGRAPAPTWQLTSWRP